MTDAGEKLRVRLAKMWGALPSKAEHPEVITSVEFTEMCVRAELEVVRQIAEEERATMKDLDIAPEIQIVVNVACDRIAAAISRRME